MRLVFFFVIFALSDFLILLSSSEARTVSDSALQRHFKCKKSYDCKFLLRGIKRDSVKCKIDPVLIESLDRSLVPSPKRYKVRGKVRYLGFWRAKYGYDVNLKNDGRMVIESRIHFKNLSDFDQITRDILQMKLNAAAETWSRYNPYGFPVEFRFRLVRDRSKAHIRGIRLSKDPKTRGPYYKKWYVHWSQKTIAHEMGHVLGLDDEYKNRIGGGSTDSCNHQSLMCHSRRGNPMSYQYYLILRRIGCEKKDRIWSELELLENKEVW